MSNGNQPPNLLLTGAGGFLGSEITRICRDKKISIRLVGRQYRDKIEDYHAIDLVSDAIPDGLFDKVDVVVHAAGLAHQFGKTSTKKFYDVNAVATERLIRAAAKNGVKHVVLISSSGVYGSSAALQDESSNCNPTGDYANSKLDGERRAIALANSTGIRLTILRMTTLYGAGDRGNLSRMIRAIDRGVFVKIGRGHNKKSLIHKSDAARACVLAAVLDTEFDGASNVETYNVAAEPITMSQVVDGCSQRLTGRALTAIPATPVKWIAGCIKAICLGRGPLARIAKSVNKFLSDDVYDGSKFNQRFGFQSEVSLAEGLNDQVAAYRAAQPPMVKQELLKRMLDLGLGVLLLALFAAPMCIIALVIKLTSPGPVLFWSHRVGRDGKTFPMAKFRSMRTDTPEVATHLLADSRSYITPIGRIIRKTSLDELPQLFNVVQGSMSFVGPRPALPSQTEVNELRDHLGVSQLKPGITGWAAINGRDELVCSEKVLFDRQYIERMSLWFDLKIILATGMAVIKRDGIKQADDEGVIPYIPYRDGNALTVLATPDVLIPSALAFKHRTNLRLVSLRINKNTTTQQIRDAIGNASEIVFVSRIDTDFISPALIESSILGQQSLQCVELPKANEGLSYAEQLTADLVTTRLIRDEVSKPGTIAGEQMSSPSVAAPSGALT